MFSTSFLRTFPGQPTEVDKDVGSGRIEAIFWDNDGVLVDTESLYFQATREVLAQAGVVLTQELFVELFMVQGRGAWHLVDGAKYGPESVARLRDKRNARYLELLTDSAKVIDGVEEVLATLSRDYRMGIVTSSHRDHFEAIHRRSGLLRYFAFVLTREDYGHAKPDPEPYLLAVQRSGLPKSACIVVEDTERGLAAATGAGLRCIVIPNALTSSCTFEGACKILKDIRTLPSILTDGLMVG